MSRAVRLIALRLATAVPTLILVGIGCTILLWLAPGDAVDAYLAETAGAADAAGLRQRWGLDAPIAARWLATAAGLVTFQFGQSIIFSRPVLDIIVERLPVTVALMGGATCFAALGGLALGLVAGAAPGGWRDRAISTTTLILNAMPNFWLAIVLIVVLAVQWPLFPVGGLRPVGAARANWPVAAWLVPVWHLVLPVLALGLGYLALYVRTLRAGMIEARGTDHVRAAEARGLARRAILWRGLARPALLPVVVLAGQQAGTLFGGSVIIETVFAIPGFGRLAYEAVTGRDTSLLIGVAMTSTLFVIAANLCVDLVLLRLDPRRGRGGD